MTQEPKIFPYIERLLQGAEVVWKPLGEVAEVSAGNSAPQDNDLFTNGVYPFCRTSDVGKVHHSINFHQIQDKLNEEGIKGLRLYKKETILLPKSGASTLLNHRVMLTIDSYVSSHLATIYRKEEVVLAKFLFYFLSKFDIAELVPDKSYPSLKVSEIAKIQIPLPPLSVQQEIVRILDKFTQLEAELEAELDCRKRQYEYYRNNLLTFNEIGGGTKVEWKTLGEVFTLRNGYTPSKSNNDFWENGTIPWFRMEDIRLGSSILKKAIQTITPEAVKGKLFPANTIIMATSATVGEHALIEVDFMCNQRFTCFILNKEYQTLFDIKFLYYYFFLLDEKAKQSVNVSSFPSVQMNELRKWEIPLPPLSEQQRIATILDKFDTLVNSISEGLPKEIALRRKQYEYYREKLLSFPKE